MKRADTYRLTRLACYFGYVTQAVTLNLPPLLYVTFQTDYAVSLGQIGLLVAVMFAVQLAVDLSSTWLCRYFSYRTGCVAAGVFAALGLLCFGFLPDLLPDPYAGILLAAVLLSVGSGLVEVQVSPVMDTLPSVQKASAMSFLHSFYCWGFVAVVLLSTLFFVAVGTQCWRLLMLLWALVPLVTAVLFLIAPVPSVVAEETGEPASLRQLMGSRTVWLLMLVMVCAGAAEMGPAQWASLFAEAGLGVSKTVGDLLGPCAFALLQGLSRLFFSRMCIRWEPRRLLLVCGVLGLIGYLTIVLSPWPLLSLLGFGVCGVAIGPMWPGLLSLGSAMTGHMGMFAILAFCGDLGCAISPGLIGAVSEGLQAEGYSVLLSLRSGIGVCMLFPLLFAVGLRLLDRVNKTGHSTRA